MSEVSRVMIHSDLFYVLQPYLIVARIAGFCPVKWTKINGGFIILEKSREFYVYTIILAHFLMVSSISGLVIDLNHPNSIRMKNRTVKYVSVVDLGEIVITAYVGMISTNFRLKSFWKALGVFQRIDSISRPISMEDERHRAIVIFSSFLTFVGLVLIYESIQWGGISAQQDLLQDWFLRYSTLWTMYFLVHVQQLSYWQLTRIIRKRIEALNRLLWKIQDNLFYQSRLLCSTLNSTPITSEQITRAMKLFCLIYEGTEASNEFCSINILMILLSCLLHLVVTLYFLLMEVTNNGLPSFIVLLVLWTGLHMTRLLMIVESCQSCISEHKVTSNLIGNLMTCQVKDDVAEQLKRFFYLVNMRKIEFSAFSLMTIDRSLLTTVTGTVCTVLVILFQYGNVGNDSYFTHIKKHANN